jgi:hypothetical protein
MWEADKDVEYRDFKRSQLGDERLAALDRRAHSTVSER